MNMNLFLQNEERRINLQNVHKNNSNGKQTRIYGIKSHNAVHIEKEFLCSTSHFGGHMYI